VEETVTLWERGGQKQPIKIFSKMPERKKRKNTTLNGHRTHHNIIDWKRGGEVSKVGGHRQKQKKIKKKKKTKKKQQKKIKIAWGGGGRGHSLGKRSIRLLQKGACKTGDLLQKT